MRVLIILLLIISCGTYTPKPIIKHVLAVTSEGDTLLIPINRIRPNIYQTIYPSYNIYDSYYYNGWRYNTNVYSNHKTYEPNNNTNNSSKFESKDISRDDMDLIKDKRNIK